MNTVAVVRSIVSFEFPWLEEPDHQSAWSQGLQDALLMAHASPGWMWQRGLEEGALPGLCRWQS